MSSPILNLESMLPPPISAPDVELVARPILKADDLQYLSFNRERDCRTSLALGLSQYLSQLSIPWAGGRNLHFRKVLTSWAEPEEPSELPSATLVAVQDAVYEASQFTPTVEKVADGTGRYLRFVAEMQQSFTLVIWATDPREREGLTAMVEDALEPTDFMTGLRLELPYYFNVRATYEKISMAYADSEHDAHRRWRRTVMTISANIPQAVPVGDLPFLAPQHQVEVSDGSEC